MSEPAVEETEETEEPEPELEGDSEPETEPEVEGTEPEVDSEKVTELVSELSVGDLAPVIAKAGPHKLAAIEEAEKAGKGRVGVLEAIEKRHAQLVEEGAEAPEFSEAPIENRLPVIDVGHWVRFTRATGVPKHLVGRDGVVVRALVRRAEGGDTLAPNAYEYQDGSEKFLVEARDTREQLEVTRDAFAAFDTDQARLLVA